MAKNIFITQKIYSLSPNCLPFLFLTYVLNEIAISYVPTMICLYTYLFFTILGSNSSIKTASRQMLQFWTSIFSRLNCQIYSTSISSFQLCQFIFDNLASHLIESSNCLFELSKAKWVLSDLIPNHSIALLRFKICWKNFHSIPMTLVSILSGEEKLLPEPGITWIDVDFTGGEEILLPLWEGNLLTNFM